MLEERILLDEKEENNTVVAITTTLSGCDDLFIIPYICTVLILIADGGYPSS
jgi:hypothetical protein